MEIIDREVNLISDFDISSISNPKTTLFFDIETTGLFKERSQIYLIGCAYQADDAWTIRQYFAERASDERLILREFARLAEGFDTFVTFNGESFDIPYIAYKADFYGMNFNPNLFNSVDIYKCTKRVKKLLGLSSIRQKAIEEFLEIFRDDSLDGGRLIKFFYEYEKSRDAGLRELLLLHNYDDMQGMIKILPVLRYNDIVNGIYEFKKSELYEDTLILDYKLECAVPVPVTYKLPTCGRAKDAYFDMEADTEITVSDNLLQINVRLYEGTGKYPLKDYKNYYYLPAEDKVIHKDVAAFVNRAHKVKATKKNCFIKKESVFVPQYRKLFFPAFTVDGDKKRTYFEASQISDITAEMWGAYAAALLSDL